MDRQVTIHVHIYIYIHVMAVSSPLRVVTHTETGTNKHRVHFGVGGGGGKVGRWPAAETTASLSGRVQSSPAAASPLLTENSALVDRGRERTRR